MKDQIKNCELLLFVKQSFRIAAIVLLFVSSISSSFSWSQTLLRGDQLKSLNTFDHDEFAATKVVLKAWQETFDGRSRFQIQFFGYSDEPEFVRGFLQEIRVFDGQKMIRVYDWDSADCSLEKFMLVRGEGSEVYLLISDRYTVPKDKGIVSQYEPATQKIRIFKLASIANDNEGEKSDHSRDYFKKIAEKHDKAAVCEASDVYRQMSIYFSEFNKN